MKTYKTYAGCERYMHTQPFPVIVGDATSWATRAALRAMEPVRDPVAFALILGGAAGGEEFDRVFTVVSDGDSWGLRTELSRGFPGEWPHIELFVDHEAAGNALQEAVARYDVDFRWLRRDGA